MEDEEEDRQVVVVVVVVIVVGRPLKGATIIYLWRDIARHIDLCWRN